MVDTSVTSKPDSALIALAKAETILLTTHERTDGDDLGTILAFKEVLEKKHKIVKIVINGGVPAHLNFLPGTEAVVNSNLINERFDLYVVSGCSSLVRTGLKGIPRDAQVLNIDHHPDNTFFGQFNVVESTAAAVAEVAFKLLTDFSGRLSQKAAQCLLTGIISDTGSFVHSNTSQKTLDIASKLFALGARPGNITKHTFGGKDIHALKAWGKALENTNIDYNKRMAVSMITTKDLLELGNPPLAVFEGLVETINKIPEVTFSLFLKQDGPIVKGSLRSDPHKQGGGVDVGQLAKKYGGGGHKFAAGFSIPGTLIRGQGTTWKILPAN